MSATSGASPASNDASSRSDASWGFRTFWSKASGNGADSSRRTPAPDALTKRKTGQNGRTSGSASSVSKRRQQVYQAQRRHRDRKAEYLKSLEEEVARLRQLDALVNSQRNVLACQNQAFREYFRAQSVSLSEPFEVPQSTGSPESSTALSHTGSAVVSVRFDDILGRERTFLDLSETEDHPFASHPGPKANGFGQQNLEQSLPPQLSLPQQQNSHWAALDFILSLEWPCKDHHVYEEISPSFAIPVAQNGNTVDPNALHNHALTMTAAVHQSAHAVSTPPGHPATIPGHTHPNIKQTLPHSEIDKLVRLSENLQLDEELTTPAQAYAYIKRIALSDAQLEACMKALQASLAHAVSCFGFGSAMPTSYFLDQVERITHGGAGR